MNDTNTKGDIALAKVIADLIGKHYEVYLPINDHPKADLLCLQETVWRLQVKYASNGIVRNYSMTRKGKYTYNSNDFDYYAVYLPTVDKVAYPSILLGGITLQTTIPDNACSFWWYEDFLNFTDYATKKTPQELGKRISSKPRPNTRKVDRPTKQELEKLVWQRPTSQLAKNLGVSDKAIEKWCKTYGINKPPRGYWSKQNQ